MYETIIWATDGSEGADAALREALALAGVTRGRIVALHCDQRLNGRAAGWPKDPEEEDHRIKISRKVDALAQDGVDIELVVRRSHHEAADVVAVAAAELGGDIIVCGTRGRSGLMGTLLGSFTQRLLHVARCPVLAVPEPAAVAVQNGKTEVGAWS
jgi:nucleotide-binding universal stress UspA family protein